MEEPRYLQADCAFRHGGHTVRLTLARSVMEVEVEAHLTADQWRGEFDAAFIEDLTRKTGNFKQFGIFCSMLESALMQSSESVSLELLTYADLETLQRKVGMIAHPPPSASPLSAKRYLILVYSVEFDRIHYPLPLPYTGRPAAALHRLVRELREELAQLRARHGQDRRDARLALRDELQRALEEKLAAEVALQALQREPDGGTAPEAMALRRAARRLENELLREKARHQREHRQLAAELAEAKASEQRLQMRVKSLTAELAACKKGRRTPAGMAPCPQERRSHSGTRHAPRSVSRESHSGRQSRPPPRSPSPAGPRLPRFDPTAFVSRQRRQKETELKNQRRGAALAVPSPARSRGRSSSAESFRSRCSAVSSGSEADERSKPLPTRRDRTRRPLSASSCNSPGMDPHPATGHKPPISSAAGRRPENRSEEPAELAEIDARLQALQEYMDSLDTRT
ncbi:LOW QUALITY PROTEIN: centrosomal protein CCDC61 [Cariama cristata]